MKPDDLDWTIKYPQVKVTLVGVDGNAFSILGRMQRALWAAGVPPEEIHLFLTEATTDSYTHLIRTCMRWVDVQ